MSIERIRQTFPKAWVGWRVSRKTEGGRVKCGTIQGTAGTLLRVLFDGEPTWQTVPPDQVSEWLGRPK